MAVREKPPATASFAHKPPVYCRGCKAQMLKPTWDQLCGFCKVEIAEARKPKGA